MRAKEKLDQAFRNAFELPAGEDVTSMAYRQHPRWDSVRHMRLIAQLESAFNIMLDTDDIIDMSSYQEAERIVTKYGVDLNA
jgi:acyl carrier protein